MYVGAVLSPPCAPRHRRGQREHPSLMHCASTLAIMIGGERLSFFVPARAPASPASASPPAARNLHFDTDYNRLQDVFCVLR